MIKSITREKVFHVLKLVLLAVTVTLVSCCPYLGR